MRIGTLHDNKSTLTKIKTLIERFANSTSLDDLIDSINNIYRDADRDPELKNWFKSLDRYFRRCLQEQGYVLQDQATDEWNAIYDKGRFLLRERYRDHTDRILDEIKFLSSQFEEDPQNKAFGNAMQKLFLDLGQDENGKPTFKPHLIKDLTEVIIPGIFENTRYVPIPRIEVSDPMIDAVVENLVIESDNLFPNVLEVGSDNYWRMGRKQVSNKHDNKVMIAGSGIQMDLRDVAYYIKKKQGFPSITDKGLMDIFLGGDGFSFKIAARNAHKSDQTHFVAVDKVDVTIKNLNIKVKESNHKLLFAIAKPLLLKVMKPVIQKALEKQIKASFEQLDSYAYAIHRDARKSIDQAKQDPENAQNIFSFYQQSWQKQMTAKKEKAKEKAKDTQVNVAMTQQDSMFKNVSLPGGISTKATEYKELAARGDRWESPVFGIGSAKESTDVPRLTQVSRKPHNTAAGRVTGGNHPGQATSTAGGLGSNTGYGSNTGSALGSNTGNYGSDTGNYGSNTGAAPNAGFSQQVDSAFDTNKNIAGGNVGGANLNQGTYHDATTAPPSGAR